MKCPICKTVLLTNHQLPDGPASHRCIQCGGQWVQSKQYWAWLQSPDRNKLTHSAPTAPAPAVDSIKAKLCPECGRLLTRAKVGHGAEFHLDRCSHCGGFWFDAAEWEALQILGLHDDVHFVFSDAWQSEVGRIERQRQHDKLLQEKLGDADFVEIQRIKKWLDVHAHRAELYAVLLAEMPPSFGERGKFNP